MNVINNKLMLLLKLLKCLCVSSTEETFSGILSISQMCNFSETIFRSLVREVFLGKGVLKICSKFTREYPCRSVISIKLQSNFIEITFRHGCPPVNFLHIFKTFFPKIFFGWMLLFLHTLHATILSANKLWEEIISELG